MHRVGFGCLVLAIFLLGAVNRELDRVLAGGGSQSESAEQSSETQEPVLIPRPRMKPSPTSPVVATPGRIQLDVVVSDADGRPATDLEPWNFSVADQGQKRKILTFQNFDGIRVTPKPPIEVMLVLDLANLPFQQVAFVRQQVDTFLREDGGRLKQPVSLFIVTATGLRVQPRPSVDGNAVAAILGQVNGTISPISPAMGSDGWMERFKASVHQLVNIAENEAKKPGRKLLIWLGPGWPMMNEPVAGDPVKNQRRLFTSIVEMCNGLREARMVLFSVTPGDSAVSGGRYTTLYRAFIEPVRSAQQAFPRYLGLKVLVTQTGGLILGPDNDLVGQIERCIAEANNFYRISFDPPPAAHADEYHAISVQVDIPGLTVRTNAGYYDEP